MKKNKIFIILTIIVAIPVISWFQMTPLSSRFVNMTIGILNLGRLFGIMGITLFAINVILTSRLTILDHLFGGLNKVYRKHHLIGGLAFTFLLFHPTALALNLALISPKEAFSFLLLPPGRPDLIFGKAALFFMTLLLIITFYVNTSYNKWRFTHKFLGVALTLAIIHTFLVSSDISNNLFLRLYISGLGFLAIISYIYRTVFPSKFVIHSDYRVDKINKLATDVIEIILSPKGKKLNFLPGQFVFVRIRDSHTASDDHPFSISTSPSSNKLGLIVKQTGNYTKSLTNLKKGALFQLEGPFGKFSNRLHQDKDQIWIAGGIGIVPFLSMAEDISNSNSGQKINLIYTVSNAVEAVHLDDLKKIVKSQPNFKFRLYSSQTSGRLSADYVINKMNTLKGMKIFICGPSSMMKDLRNQFVQNGIDNDDIYSEEFDL